MTPSSHLISITPRIQGGEGWLSSAHPTLHHTQLSITPISPSHPAFSSSPSHPLLHHTQLSLSFHRTQLSITPSSPSHHALSIFPSHPALSSSRSHSALSIAPSSLSDSTLSRTPSHQPSVALHHNLLFILSSPQFLSITPSSPYVALFITPSSQ